MKVLLVDDHPLVLTALQAVIGNIGNDIQVSGAASAAAARQAMVADPEIKLLLPGGQKAYVSKQEVVNLASPKDHQEAMAAVAATTAQLRAARQEPVIALISG